MKSFREAYRKKVGDMVAKGAIVGMLLDRHDLDGIVAQLPDSGQHLLPEGGVAVDFGFCTTHAHVALVDSEGLRLGRPGVLEGVGAVCCRLCSGFSLLRWGIVDAIELDLIPLLKIDSLSLVCASS